MAALVKVIVVVDVMAEIETRVGVVDDLVGVETAFGFAVPIWIWIQLLTFFAFLPF